MEITWNNLLARIKADPLSHLGGVSPRLLDPYFVGYGYALRFHEKGDIQGEYGVWDFNRWFASRVYGGPQGWASYCVLLTNLDEEALDLFFEFHHLFIKSGWRNVGPESSFATSEISMLDLLKSDAVRTRPAMYFGNDLWLPSLWAMWNGYVWAEKDTSVQSPDQAAFVGFQDWLDRRFEFEQRPNFAKIFDFKALNVNEKALEDFFDHFDLYLTGAPPDTRTSKYQAFLDEAVGAILKDQKKHES